MIHPRTIGPCVTPWHFARAGAAMLLAFATSVALAGMNADRSVPDAGKQGDERDGAGHKNRGVFPAFSKPHGHTYSEWAATWWQWALQMPATGHPLLVDGSSASCMQGQEGKVWFLGGSFSNNGTPIYRTCEIPAGKALFFPLVSFFYGAFLNDPAETRTEDFIRNIVECFDPVINVTIDGHALKRPTQYLERSVLFDVQLPVDNVFGLSEAQVPELKLSPSVDMGYYLFLAPLKVGAHLIAWSAKMTCPYAGGEISQNVTYAITVHPGRED